MPWESARKDPAYGRADYRRKRAAALKRARGRCERRLPGCQGAASQANHRDGLANDPHHEHLEAICDNCHKIITAQQGNDAKGARAPSDPAPRPRTAW